MLTPPPHPEDKGYGYGLGVEVDNQDGYRRVGHQGDCPGFCSYAYGCLETGVGVVVLGNGTWEPPGASGAWAVVEHGLALLRAAVLGEEPPPDPPPPVPGPPGGDGAPLVPLAGGGFRVGDDPHSPERVEFTAVVEGRPTRAVVSGWPFDRVGP